MESEPGALAPSEVLREVSHTAQQLMSRATGPLQRVVVRVGEVLVELEWPVAETRAPALAVTAQTADGTLLTAAAGTAPEPREELLHHVRADLVGTFYAAPEPGAKPYVDVGDIVEVGQQVGLLEAMKLMTPVLADGSGRVVEILVGNGDAVEFGAGLITLAPLDPA